MHVVFNTYGLVVGGGGGGERPKESKDESKDESKAAFTVEEVRGVIVIVIAIVIEDLNGL